LRESNDVAKLGANVVMGGALTALALVLTPAIAASTQAQKPAKPKSSVSSLIAGNFTPAVADPRLAAELARRGFSGGDFAFTPSTASTDKSKSVKVAVRARSITTAAAAGAVREASASPVTAITPTAYNLGVSVGWKRFALSGEVAKVEGGTLPGVREAAEVGVSYVGKKFTGRVQVGAERSDGIQSRLIPMDDAYSLDVGGSYRLARNLDVTGGVRYTYTGRWCSPGRQTSWNGEWRLSGEKGSAHWDGDRDPVLDADVDPAPRPGAPYSGIEGALLVFTDALRTGVPPMGEVHENVLSLAMVEAAVRSADSGQRVLLDDVLADAHAEAMRTETHPDVRDALAAWPSVRSVLTANAPSRPA
jgi:hypothetical protein